MSAVQGQWANFLGAHQGTYPWLSDPVLTPKTAADLQAIRELVGKLPQQPNEQFVQLFNAYKKHTPAIVLANSVERTAKTLKALLDAGITADKLETACTMSRIRDIGAQLTASTAGYLGSFFTFNSVLAKLIREQADPAVQSTLPALVHTATSLVVQRFLRTAEMYPGWTRPVEADSKGAPAGAITTDRGYQKTLAQYWPFFAPLLVASLGTPDPALATDPATRLDRTADRVELRRDWGFLATAGVALHRIYAFDREHVWLDASNPAKERTMRGAIAELTSVPQTAAALGKYVLVRPLAGAAGVMGLDLHPAVNAAYEWASGTARDSKDERPAWPQPSGVSGLFSQLRTTAMRATALLSPMYLFNAARSLSNSAPGHSNLINVANDTLLIAGWGYAMAESEHRVATDPELSAENALRSQRQQVALARRATPAQVAPPAESSAAGSPGAAGDVEASVQQH